MSKWKRLYRSKSHDWERRKFHDNYTKGFLEQKARSPDLEILPGSGLFGKTVKGQNESDPEARKINSDENDKSEIPAQYGAETEQALSPIPKSAADTFWKHKSNTSLCDPRL